MRDDSQKCTRVDRHSASYDWYFQIWFSSCLRRQRLQKGKPVAEVEIKEEKEYEEEEKNLQFSFGIFQDRKSFCFAPFLASTNVDAEKQKKSNATKAK